MEVNTNLQKNLISFHKIPCRFYAGLEGREMNDIKVSNAELSYIESLAKKHNVTISRLLLNMVYTYFFSLSKGKADLDLINNSDNISSE